MSERIAEVLTQDVFVSNCMHQFSVNCYFCYVSLFRCVVLCSVVLCLLCCRYKYDIMYSGQLMFMALTDTLE